MSKRLTTQLKALIVSACCLLTGLGLAVGISEVVLRALTQDESYYIWPPGLHRIFYPAREFLPGASEKVNFIINSVGLRGDEPPDDGALRLVTVGGSTTECLYLDQQKTWPGQLQSKLTERGIKAWVGNAGRSGHNTRNHVLQVGKLLEQVRPLDVVIVLAGANDLGFVLAKGPGYVPWEASASSEKDELLYRSFAVVPLAADGKGLIRQSAIWARLRRARHDLVAILGRWSIIQDDRGERIEAWRRRRRDAREIIQHVPVITEALREYRDNLSRIATVVRSAGAKVLFLTQPAAWGEGLPRELEDTFWAGGIGDFQNEDNGVYYSAGVLEELLGQYNRTLLEVCGDEELQCFDLAGFLSGVGDRERVFYDDFHFTEYGAEKVGEVIAVQVAERELR